MNNNNRKRSLAVSEVFKALGHPSRLCIVETLSKGEYCVCQLRELVGTDISTVSRHLSILKNAGIVKDRKEGTTVHYSLTCDCFAQMLAGAENIIRQKNDSRNYLPV